MLVKSHRVLPQWVERWSSQLLCCGGKTNMGMVYGGGYKWVCDLSCCTARQRKWQKNTIQLHCWISHSRGILNGIHIAVEYSVTNRILTTVSHTAALMYQLNHTSPQTNCMSVIMMITLFRTLHEGSLHSSSFVVWGLLNFHFGVSVQLKEQKKKKKKKKERHLENGLPPNLGS